MKPRAMEAEDIEAVVALVAEAMNAEEGAWARTTFRRHFASRASGHDDGRAYLVFEHEAVIAGISGLHCWEWGPPENVWLGWFALHPRFHGRGWGRAMLRATEAEARSRGHGKLLIETYDSPTFERAVAFYRRCGYDRVGGIRGYLPDGASMLVFMKNLPPKTLSMNGTG